MKPSKPAAKLPVVTASTEEEKPAEVATGPKETAPSAAETATPTVSAFRRMSRRLSGFVKPIAESSTEEAVLVPTNGEQEATSSSSRSPTAGEEPAPAGTEEEVAAAAEAGDSNGTAPAAETEVRVLCLCMFVHVSACLCDKVGQHD